MRLLLTAFCCAPGSGSEQGFGWRWVTACARDHEVTVVTPTAQRAAIEAEPLATELGIRWVYVPGPRRVSASGNGYRFERTHQYLWELRAIPTVRRLARELRPDVAQHVTTGTWRVPSCLAFTPVPYILGPLAGSERLPPGMFRSLGAAGILEEQARELQMAVARLDPLVRRSLRRASVILAAGAQTVEELEARFPEKTRRFGRAYPHPAITRPAPVVDEAAGAGDEGALQLTWVGRLTSRKGLPILLRALADPRLARYRLDVFGDGPERERLVRAAERFGVAERVRFRGHVPQHETFAAVAASDVFVFTSLHDLMGQALSEAMQLGTACVVLDWSGPSVLVGDTGAVKVPVTTPTRTSAALADALAGLAGDPVRRRSLRRAARARIEEVIDPVALAARRDEAFAVAAARADVGGAPPG